MVECGMVMQVVSASATMVLAYLFKNIPVLLPYP